MIIKKRKNDSRKAHVDEFEKRTQVGCSNNPANCKLHNGVKRPQVEI